MVGETTRDPQHLKRSSAPEEILSTSRDPQHLEEILSTWGPDPIHPEASCYSMVATEIIRLSEVRAAPEATRPPGGPTALKERPRWLDVEEGQRVGSAAQKTIKLP